MTVLSCRTLLFHAPEDDPSAILIIGRHFDGYLVARKHPDAELREASRQVRNDLLAVLEAHAELQARQRFRDFSNLGNRLGVLHSNKNSAPSNTPQFQAVRKGASILPKERLLVKRIHNLYLCYILRDRRDPEGRKL